MIAAASPAQLHVHVRSYRHDAQLQLRHCGSGSRDRTYRYRYLTMFDSAESRIVRLAAAFASTCVRMLHSNVQCAIVQTRSRFRRAGAPRRTDTRVLWE